MFISNFEERLNEEIYSENFPVLGILCTYNDHDTSHFKPEVGGIMIRCMVDGQVDQNLLEQGFGWYVTKDNVNDLCELLFD